MTKGIWISIIAATFFMTGCAASSGSELKPIPEHEKMTIAEAETIVDERNKQIVLDVDKIARVTAILTKRLQHLEDKINGVAEQGLGIKGATDDIYLLKKDLANLRVMKEEHDKMKSDVDELNRVKDEYLLSLSNKKIESFKEIEKEKVEKKPEPKKEPVKKKKKVFVAPAIEDFVDEEGKVIVKYKTAFTRTAPNSLRSSKSTTVKEGDVFTYTAKSEHWYKLKSGLYINKMVVCETSLCAGVAKKGEPIGAQKPAKKASSTKQPPLKPAPAVNTKTAADIIKPASK